MLKIAIKFIILVLAVLSVHGMTVAQPSGTGLGFAGYDSPTAVTHSPNVSPNLPPTTGNTTQGVLLLNNDQVVFGEILTVGETVEVRNEVGVMQIRRSDIAMSAATLKDVYRSKSSQTRKNTTEFLKLADWCVTNKLKDEAAYEYDRAILWAENRQAADAIRNRKNAALSMFEDYRLQVEMTEREKEKYQRWKERIPGTTFATFKRDILPMLVQNCSGVACHSANSLSEFRLIPNQHNNDVDVGKNLQVVLGYITPGMPEESPLVLVPIAPHGRTKQIFTRRNYKNYEKLYFWAEQVAEEMDAYYPLDESDRVAKKSAGNRSRAETPESESATTFRHASGDNVTFPMPGEKLVDDDPSPRRESSDLTPTSMAQGMTTVFSGQTVPRGDFDFFNQHAVALPGTSPGGWQRPIPAHLDKSKEKVVMTHGSTEAFERDRTLQQLRQDPVDPFDPVLFNRQYHFNRLEKSDQIQTSQQ